MNIVVTILGLISTVLEILKSIPQTSEIAVELQNFENAFTDVLAAAQKANTQAQVAVDSSQLNQINPIT